MVIILELLEILYFFSKSLAKLHMHFNCVMSIQMRKQLLKAMFNLVIRSDIFLFFMFIPEF